MDFYCPEKRLAIELDGSSHDKEAAYVYDQKRTAYLSDLDITVLRFENRSVFEATEGVLEEIRKAAKTLPPPSPSFEMRGRD